MRLKDCYRTDDFRRLAQRRLPAPIFHYIDGGADDEATLRRNTAAFDEVDLVPRVLAGIDEVDLSVEVLGARLRMPLFFAPTALQRLFHHEGERAIARAPGVESAAVNLAAETAVVRFDQAQIPQLLEAVRGAGYEPVLEAIRRSGCGSRIRRLGYVDRADLPALLSGARLFVYPSLAEGFGFPPLEAMACGVPTIAARSTSLAENLEGAAELVPADDGAALAAAILKLLRDPGVRSALRERGRERAARFRWQRTAELTADCYRALGRGMKRAPGPVH